MVMYQDRFIPVSEGIGDYIWPPTPFCMHAQTAVGSNYVHLLSDVVS